MSKKILVVLTNTPKYPAIKRATGLWLGEAVHFVYAVLKAGYPVDYVSPGGGYVPIDPHSLQMAPHAAASITKAMTPGNRSWLATGGYSPGRTLPQRRCWRKR